MPVVELPVTQFSSHHPKALNPFELPIMTDKDNQPINPEEEEAIKELKLRLQDEMKLEYLKDESMFLRFLRARQSNLNKAEDMLRNHIQWREKNDIDHMDTYKPPEVSKYFPMSLIAFSKAGNPVRYLNFGNMDAKAVQMLAYLMMTYEAHYPERLKKAYIINASVYFTLLFSVVKPLFTGATLSKISIYGKEGWKEDLLQHVDAEELPAFLGGTRVDTDGNPKCPSVVNHGGSVPPSYYLRSSNKRLCHQPGVKKLHVSRMSKVNVTLDVEEPGSHIEWEFETENKDIGFGLYFQSIDTLQEKQDKLKELIPKQRVEAHMACETGMFQCEIPGTYILMFDNSYSWLQQKEIFFRAIVVRPTGEKISVLQ
ncbi:unnamed protein product [Larinioides sclopetarius]|uniref:SEC14-like protein 2 n=1 Tax=Larinioides sclopetarius TaxID=280406 RepID=A0AAV2A044_9ARAC